MKTLDTDLCTSKIIVLIKIHEVNHFDALRDSEKVEFLKK